MALSIDDSQPPHWESFEAGRQRVTGNSLVHLAPANALQTSTLYAYGVDRKIKGRTCFHTHTHTQIFTLVFLSNCRVICRANFLRGFQLPNVYKGDP